MGIGQNLANANAGITAFATASAKQQNLRLIQQNDEIIALLKEQNAALQYLAKAKSHEVAGR